MTTTNTKSLCEFPEPIVAAYVDRVRNLSDAQLTSLNRLPHTSLVRWSDPATWWLAPIAACMWLTSMWRLWMIHRIGTAGCRDVGALREYRLLWNDLSHRGWRPIGESRIALGLYTLRWRHVLADARHKYTTTIGAFVPSAAIGWTDHEASA
jgi:hypothetical protein